MDIVQALAHIRNVQAAFSVISALLLTSYLFPPQANVNDSDEFDFIIVGAGTAGNLIADRLTEIEDISVLVIDAGGDPPVESMVPSLFPFLPATIHDWNITSEEGGTSECPISSQFNLTCGRVLGGSSSMNYMVYVRGAPADFDAWEAAVDDRTWGWSGVFPYFLKSEMLDSETFNRFPHHMYHGVNGFHGVTREARSEVYKYLDTFAELHDIVEDINGEQNLGYTLPFYSISNGLRQTSAYTNLARQKRRKNLHVLKNTLVTEILFDDDKNAIGVKAIIENSRPVTIKSRKEVIVSAGALNSPKVLMLSGIGPKEHLESLNITVKSDLPVGLNYQDHVLTLAAIRMEDSNETAAPANPRMFPFPLFTGYVSLYDQTYPDYQAINFIIPSDSIVPSDVCAFNFAQDPYICQNLYEAGKGKITIFLNLALLHPRSRGRVTLRSTDPEDPPRVCTGTFSDERDLEDMTSAMVDYFQVMNTTHFKEVGAEIVDLKLRDCIDIEFGSREYWKCFLKTVKTTMFHYSGTCSLGSVVDSRLRVLNVKRLRVADASVMPKLVSGNTHAAVMMIAEKAADMVKDDLNDLSPCYSFLKYITGFHRFFSSPIHY